MPCKKTERLDPTPVGALRLLGGGSPFTGEGHGWYSRNLPTRLDMSDLTRGVIRHKGL